MKHLIIFSLIYLFVQPVSGQQDSAYIKRTADSTIRNGETNLPIPEFQKKPYFLDEKNNSLSELEKPNLTIQGKLKGLGKAQGLTKVENPSSSFKIKKADTLRFIVRVTPGADPSDEFELVAFMVKKNERQIVLAEVNVWNNTSKNVYVKIPYKIKKVIEGVYLLLVINLQPGEYFIANGGVYYAFSLE